MSPPWAIRRLRTVTDITLRRFGDCRPTGGTNEDPFVMFVTVGLFAPCQNLIQPMEDKHGPDQQDP